MLKNSRTNTETTTQEMRKKRKNIKMKYKKTETKLFPKYENSEFPLHYRVEFLRNGKLLLYYFQETMQNQSGKLS